LHTFSITGSEYGEKRLQVRLATGESNCLVSQGSMFTKKGYKGEYFSVKGS